MRAFRSMICGGSGLILGLIGTASLAQSEPGGSGYEVAWQSANATIQALPHEIQIVTLNLLNSGVLRTREVEVSTKDPRPSVVFQNAYPYLTWGDLSASLLCDLNNDQCSRPMLVPPNLQAESVDGHILGTKVSPSEQVEFALNPVKPTVPWLAGEDVVFRVTVPDITFRYDTNWRQIDIDPVRDTLSEIYYTIALGCRGVTSAGVEFSFQGQFPDLIAKLNGEAQTSCPLDIFLRNYWDLSFELSRGATRDRSTRAMAGREAEVLLADFEERLDASLDPWGELDAIVAEIAKLTGRRNLAMQLPVLSLSADVSVAGTLYSDFGDKRESPDTPFWAQTSIGTAFDRLNQTNQRLQVIDRRIDLKLRLDNNPNLGEVLNLPHATLKDMKLHVLAGQREKLFDLINFPAAGGPEFSEFSPRMIVIVDQGFAADMKHCVFDSQTGDDTHPLCDIHAPLWQEDLLPMVGDNVPPEVRNAVEAFYSTDPFTKRRSKIKLTHGHAVASVAAAKMQSGMMVGVDPLAYAIPFNVNIDSPENDLRATAFSTRIQSLQDNLRQRKYYGTRLIWGGRMVWNLSLHFEDLGNKNPALPLLDHIRENRWNTSEQSPRLEYFVFAAGNVAEEVLQADQGGNCRVYPACLVADHDEIGTMVTVIGAQMDDNAVPELWRDLDRETVSYANPSFQVAAIAKDVPVAVIGDGTAFAIDSGTSYAAPQVAALISNLRGAEIHHPTEILGRLMACARLSSKLEGFVLGGLIDAGCTLEIEKAQMAYDDGDPEHLNLRAGQLLNIWRMDSTPGNGVTTVLPVIKTGPLAGKELQVGPDPDLPSLAGFRTLVDDERRINIVGWHERRPDPSNSMLAHAEVLTDTRILLQDNRILEFKFDGEDKPICVRLYKVTQFIPAYPDLVPEFRDTPGPECDTIGEIGAFD